MIASVNGYTGFSQDPKLYLRIYKELGVHYPHMLNPGFLGARTNLAKDGATYIALFRRCVDQDFDVAWRAFVARFHLST